MARIEVDHKDATGKLSNLIGRLRDGTPYWKAVRELLIDSTRKRFATSTGPDGKPWAPNSAATIENFLRGRGNVRFTRGARAGLLNARGGRIVGNKKPLIGRTRQLSKQIVGQASKDGVVIGSSRIQAAVQQYGQDKGQSGTTKNGNPIPWGNIPARPFLGLSKQDDAAMRDTWLDYLEAVLE